MFIAAFIYNIAMLVTETVSAGDFLRDPFGFDGSWELHKYGTDTHG